MPKFRFTGYKKKKRWNRHTGIEKAEGVIKLISWFSMN